MPDCEPLQRPTVDVTDADLVGGQGVLSRFESARSTHASIFQGRLPRRIDFFGGTPVDADPRQLKPHRTQPRFSPIQLLRRLCDAKTLNSFLPDPKQIVWDEAAKSDELLVTACEAHV